MLVPRKRHGILRVYASYTERITPWWCKMRTGCAVNPSPGSLMRHKEAASKEHAVHSLPGGHAAYSHCPFELLVLD